MRRTCGERVTACVPGGILRTGSISSQPKIRRSVSVSFSLPQGNVSKLYVINFYGNRDSASLEGLKMGLRTLRPKLLSSIASAVHDQAAMGQTDACLVYRTDLIYLLGQRRRRRLKCLRILETKAEVLPVEDPLPPPSTPPRPPTPAPLTLPEGRQPPTEASQPFLTVLPPPRRRAPSDHKSRMRTCSGRRVGKMGMVMTKGSDHAHCAAMIPTISRIRGHGARFRDARYVHVVFHE
jgi:hypothetical protein